MALLLTQYYEKEKDKELVNEFNNTLKKLQSTTGNFTAEEMIKQMQDIIYKLEKVGPQK